MDDSTRRDWDWANGYWDEILRVMRICLPKLVLIEVAPPSRDLNEATDYIIQISGGNVACRIRNSRGNCAPDLTIRSRRASGVSTEIDKLRTGYADWYLYAWVLSNRFENWMLIDTRRLRAEGILDKPRREIANRDGKTWFIAIPISELYDHQCIARASDGLRQLATQKASA